MFFAPAMLTRRKRAPHLFSLIGSIGGFAARAAALYGHRYTAKTVVSVICITISFFYFFGCPPWDPPPLKWSDLRYVFDIKDDCNGKEAIQV
jgi:hypothetical protein